MPDDPKTVEKGAAGAEARAERRRRDAASRRRWRARRREKDRAARAERPAREPVPGKQHGPGRPKTRQGVVVSAKPDKTITVRIDITRRHREYKKIVRESSTLHVHDERNEAHEGDTVRVVETRPISRTKRWRLVEILERAR
jgi:small subunit ribosomal protein S17